MHRPPAPLAALTLVLACTGAVETKSGTAAGTPTATTPSKHEPAKPEPKPEPAKPEPIGKSLDPGPPRALLVMRPAKDLVALTYLPDATPAGVTAARDLEITADWGSGAVQVGSSGPFLSADGQWIAMIRKWQLVVQRVDGTVTTTLTKFKPGSVELLISGFSPDSSKLLYNLGESQADDPAPLPKGVEAGFYLLTLADMTTARVPGLEGFDAWLPDSTTVIYQHRDRPGTTLMKADINAPTGVPLQTTAATFGFGQLITLGEHVAYIDHDHLVRRRLDGSDPQDLTDKGAFAQYQEPRFAPDGARIALRSNLDILIVDLATAATTKLTACEDPRCRPDWDTAATVLVHDGDVLRRFGLDTTSTEVATGVKAFTVAGGAA
jgi:hypothetical protein